MAQESRRRRRSGELSGVSVLVTEEDRLEEDSEVQERRRVKFHREVSNIVQYST